jgi:hypothetical protein
MLQQSSIISVQQSSIISVQQSSLISVQQSSKISVSLYRDPTARWRPPLIHNHNCMLNLVQTRANNLQIMGWGGLHLLNPEPGFLCLGLLHGNVAGLASVGWQRLQLDVVAGICRGGWLVGVTHHQDVLPASEGVLVDGSGLQQHLTIGSCNKVRTTPVSRSPNNRSLSIDDQCFLPESISHCHQLAVDVLLVTS